MLFRESRRSNPTAKPNNPNKGQNTFLKFRKNIEYGEKEVDELIYKVVKKKDGIYNYIYIGNPFKIGICERKGFNDVEIKDTTLLQIEDDIYLIVGEGHKGKLFKPYLQVEIRTLLYLVPDLEIALSHDTEGEVKYIINTEKQKINYIAEDGNEYILEGYELRYVGKKVKNEIEKVEENEKENLENEQKDFNFEIQKSNDEDDILPDVENYV